MKNLSQIFAVIISLFFIHGQLFAQLNGERNFFAKIKNYNFSTVLLCDSIVSQDREGSIEKVKHAEALGFIGNDYQRFFIHFNSIVRNPANSYQYLVEGKTKVKENICSFHGTITIISSRISSSTEYKNYQVGFADCDVKLYENKTEPASGFITGRLKAQFLIDPTGQLRYSGLGLPTTDGFSNNQFVGKWTSYKTKLSKKCNWGDYRIPESGDLDIGAGEFSVNEKYKKNGWENYILAYNIGLIDKNQQHRITALQKENEHWWE